MHFERSYLLTMMSCYQHLFCYHFINTFNFLSVPVGLLFEPTGLDESSPETRSFPCLCRIFTCHRRSSTSATMSVAGAVKSLLLLGRCAPSVKQNASKIVVKKLELDENLLMVNQNCLFFFQNIFLCCIRTVYAVFFFSTLTRTRSTTPTIQNDCVKRATWCLFKNFRKN